MYSDSSFCRFKIYNYLGIGQLTCEQSGRRRQQVWRQSEKQWSRRRRARMAGIDRSCRWPNWEGMASGEPSCRELVIPGRLRGKGWAVHAALCVRPVEICPNVSVTTTSFTRGIFRTTRIKCVATRNFNFLLRVLFFCRRW